MPGAGEAAGHGNRISPRGTARGACCFRPRGASPSLRSCLPGGASIRKAIAASLPLRRQPLSPCSAPALWARSEELLLASSPGLPQSAGRSSSPSGYELLSGLRCTGQLPAWRACPFPAEEKPQGCRSFHFPGAFGPFCCLPTGTQLPGLRLAPAGPLILVGIPGISPRTERAVSGLCQPPSYSPLFFVLARLTVSSGRFHCPRHNVHVWLYDVFLLEKEVIG